jgi:hypothetical protein
LGGGTGRLVILPIGAAIKAFASRIGENITPEIIWRQELGHCNGWGGDHAGARSNDAAAAESVERSR